MFGAHNQHTKYDENAALGILQHLDQAELQRLLDDESKIDEMIKDLSQVLNLSSEKENLITSNKSLADYNLSREPALTHGKTQLAQVYEQAVEVQKTYEESKHKLESMGAQQSLDTTLMLIQTETAKSEEEAEEISDSFLDGNIEVDDFIEQYIGKRKIGHLRKVKSEKLAEIVRDRAAAARNPVPPPRNHTAAPAPYAAPGGAPYPAPGQAPYPAPGQAPYPAPGNAPYPAPGGAPYPGTHNNWGGPGYGGYGSGSGFGS